MGNFGNMRRSAQQNSDDLNSCGTLFCILFFGTLGIAGFVFWMTGMLS